MKNDKVPLYYKIDEWEKQEGINTTGTRDKGIYVSQENLMSYFFKTSLTRYPFEFWSEIAASLLGKHLKLPILEYHIASYMDKIGCISLNMVNREQEELVEGVNFIVEQEPYFKNYCKENHRFDKIEKALKGVGLIDFRRIVIEMILFDCIIGNTDRHSENWALIRNKEGETLYTNIKKKSWLKRIKTYWDLHKATNIPFFKIRKAIAHVRHRFAPFYDNGSSLGRELTEEKIKTLLSSKEAFNHFFKGGKSDIIMNSGKKMTFLETIDYALCHYPEECKHFIVKHLNQYNKDEFETLINMIDENYPEHDFAKSRISNIRKTFIVTLINARIQYIYQKCGEYGLQI
jgi:hypothetical protein